jgi:hypothetical protein
MSRKKSFEITDTLKSKIISSAYKDASLIDKISVWLLIRRCEEAKKIFDSYRSTANEVAKLAEDECPEFIIDSVKIERTFFKSGFVADLYSILFVRPIASLAVVIIVVSAIIFGTIRNRTVEYEFTEAEVIKADKQARHAFAIVGNIFRETKQTLENDVLGDKVSKPLNKGLRIINNLFAGEKNELN